MKIQFDDKTEEFKEGEMIIVPKGVYHKPIAENDCHVMLFEPNNTINTGDQTNYLTKMNLSKI